MKTNGLNIPINTNSSPIRHPCVGYSCEGSVDTDSGGGHHFKHHSTGRDNWKRGIRKKQRRAWKRVDEDEEL